MIYPIFMGIAPMKTLQCHEKLTWRHTAWPMKKPIVYHELAFFIM